MSTAAGIWLCVGVLGLIVAWALTYDRVSDWWEKQRRDRRC